MRLIDNGNKVKDCYENFLRTGDITSFSQEAGLWCMWHAQTRLMATEDECSELFLRVWSCSAKLLSIYQSQNYKNILGNLAILSKNFLYSLRKKDNRETLEKDISTFLFIESSRKKDSNSETRSARKRLRSYLSRLDIEERVIICLKFNIPLRTSEKTFLEKLFFNKKENLYKLKSLIDERMEKLKERESRLLSILNRYNTKILNRERLYKTNLKERKQKLLLALLKRDELLTIQEIQDFLAKSKYKITQTTQNSLYRFKEEDELLAA